MDSRAGDRLRTGLAALLAGILALWLTGLCHGAAPPDDFLLGAAGPAGSASVQSEDHAGRSH